MADYVDFEPDDEMKSDVKKPFPRCGHVAVRLKRNVVMFGGAYDNTATDHEEKFKYYSLRVIWSYNLDIDRWMKFVLPNTHGLLHRIESCAVVIGSEIYVHGGWSGAWDGTQYSCELHGCLWKLSMKSDRSIAWTGFDLKNAQDFPSNRTGHVGWEYQNTLWIFGGFGLTVYGHLHDNEDVQFLEGSVRLGYNNQLWCFKPSTEKWMSVKCSGVIPSPREAHAVTKIRKNIWLYGGREQHNLFHDLYELSMPTLTWTQIHTTGSLHPMKHYYHSLVAISDEKIVVCGGSENSSVWILDLSSLLWKRNTPINFSEQQVKNKGRKRLTGTLGLSGIVIFGQQNSTDHLCSKF